MLRKAQQQIHSSLQKLSSVLRPESELSQAQRWAVGLVNLWLVIIFWVSSSFLVSDLFETNVYRKPFFMTWINTSCFVLLLIPYMKCHGYSAPQFLRSLRNDYCEERLKSDVENSSLTQYGSLHDHTENITEDSSQVSGLSSINRNAEVGICETLVLSLQFSVLWFSANLITNASLSYTSVASQTILSSTSSFFTLIFGYLYRIEKINRNKILGIALSFMGVLIVTKIDSFTTLPDGLTPFIALWGNLLALGGALIYGVYTILLKHKTMCPGTTKERILNTHLFFGFLGLFCLVMVWPVLVLLHFTGVESFELPQSAYVLKLLTMNAFITFISDFCWCKAMLLTSPLTVTVGLSLTIPFAMICDWAFKGFNFNTWYLFGAVIVTLGFFVINRDEKEDFIPDSE